MQDEIKAYLDGHFIGSTKACWKIFEFNMHEESPAVQRLLIHLPNELSQMATYWFVIDGLDIWKAQKSKVRQAANDVVKSKV